MRLRVYNTYSKLGCIVLGYLLFLLGSGLLFNAAGGGESLAQVLNRNPHNFDLFNWFASLQALIFFAGIYFLSRIFRGANESEAPRPWWKMTGGLPTAVLMVVLLFPRGGWEQGANLASRSAEMMLMSNLVAYGLQVVLLALYLGNLIYHIRQSYLATHQQGKAQQRRLSA